MPDTESEPDTLYMTPSPAPPATHPPNAPAQTITYHVLSSTAPTLSPASAPHPARRRRLCRPTGGLSYLRSRELGLPPSSSRGAVVRWAESRVLGALDQGEYLDLDRHAALVRSTISIAFSSDGAFFASTHGDHTVKVFEYPAGRQVAWLDGHPRTPWTVRFHPKNPRLLATGCLGNEVRVWDHVAGVCVRKVTFASSISCVSFSPDGTLLAVTSGHCLMLWDWTAGGSSDAGTTLASGAPMQLLRGAHPFYCCDFHPSGRMIMCGEKNKLPSTSPDANPGSDEQFTLQITIHRFDKRVGVDFSRPVLVVPRVVAYNDAGIHFSPCGTMLAACVPGTQANRVFRIAVIAIIPKVGRRVGDVLYETRLDAGRTIALTNLKFSPSSTHLLAGYSFRQQNPVLRTRAEAYSSGIEGSFGGGRRGCIRPPQIGVVDIYEMCTGGLEIRRSLTADVDVSDENVGAAQDEINVAVFAPCREGYASGVCYGSQKGRIRMFQQFRGEEGEYADIGKCGWETDETDIMEAD